MTALINNSGASDFLRVVIAAANGIKSSIVVRM